MSNSFCIVVTRAFLVLTIAWSAECSSRKLDDISDIVKIFQDTLLQVDYGSHTVDAGKELTPTQVKSQPSVKWPTAADEYYTLCMIDPDAPSREKPDRRHWLHWLVGNIPGNDISAGETLAEYVGSGPSKGSGLHRYTFLLFKQPKKVTFNETLLKKTSVQGRSYFSFKEFAEKYNFQLPPIAGNYYNAQWDSYVPELYHQLGVN